MPYVALTRASTISPILEFLRRNGVPVVSVLASVGLPSWIGSDPEVLIPADSPARLFAAASRNADIPNLGLIAAERATIDNLGMFGRLIRSAPTLGTTLDAAVRYGTAITANRPLSVRTRKDRVEFCLTVTDGFDPRDLRWQQDNHFCLGLMMSVVRLAAGSTWRPDEVHLQTDEALALRDAHSLARARIAFGQPTTMVAVPRELLAAPMPPIAGPEIPLNVIEDWTSSAPAHDFTASIRQAVETLSCGNDYPTIRDTADFVHMSVRTLQRRLAAAATSHDVLVAQARFATAAAVLERTDAKILDLALDLGYSDHANFTRAFRRWAGCSPHEYRVRRRSVGRDA